MNYEQTLDYLFSQLPMFQRVGAAAYKANLDNTYAILKVLDNPHNNFKSIHIAGTNGKGSVAHLLASVLQEAGYKTGLYTSPHLKDFRERIRINGVKVPEEYVIRFVEKYKEEFEEICPSFFEMTVGMAFKYFEEEKVDIAILEVGMGGRLDSTNVVTPELSIITNISLDHTQFLGESIEEIAAEKAAIIKPGIPVVIGETQAETMEIFSDKARRENAAIYFADQNFAFQVVEEVVEKRPCFRTDINFNASLFIEGLKCPLTGFYQLKNIITTIQSIEVLNHLWFRITLDNTRHGFEKVIENTGMMGRWQILSHNPYTICDTGHNIEGIRNIVHQLCLLKFFKLHFVIGMVNDKNIDKILGLLPREATYYFCKANIPRGLDQQILSEKAATHGLTGEHYPTVTKAYEAAQEQADKNDLVFVGGSTFVVAEVV